jgi:MFS family permease
MGRPERTGRTAGDRPPAGIYYGWKVVAALFCAGFMFYGGGLYLFVLFVPPLIREFHWPSAATSALVTAFWLSAPLILIGGAAIKRIGALRMLIAGMLLEALSLVLLSQVSQFWQMYALRAAIGVGKVLCAVTLPYWVSRWFAQQYSLALGVTWAGWHVGGLVLAVPAGVVIANYGWRTACLAIAAGLVTVGLLPTLLTQRYRTPADCGLGLDGAALADGSKDESTLRVSQRQDTPQGSLGMLLRAPIFWWVALISLFFFVTYGGLLAHEAAVVEGAGFSPKLSAVVLGSTAGFAAIGCLTVGWLLDRYSVRSVGFALHLLLLVGALSLLLVATRHATAALITYAVCFGITIGGGDLYFVAIFRRRFPDVSVAYSYSAWYFCQILSLLISGPLAGYIYDRTGQYDRALKMLCGCALVSLCMSWPMLRKRVFAQTG